MSRTAIIVLVIVALGLGATLYFVNQKPHFAGGNGSSPGSSTPTGPAFEVDTAQVVALTVTEPGGVTRSVYKTPVGGWIYAELPVTTEPDIGWPVDVSRVRSALQTLSPIPAAGRSDSVTVDDSAPIIELRLADGTVRSLQVERESVGGNSLALVDSEQTVLIPSDTVSDILSQGPESWRLTSPLAGLNSDPSRITIASGNNRVALAKVENRWTIRGPISARADEVMIRSLLSELAKMRISEFTDSTNLVTDPVVTFEVERDDVVSSDGSARRVTRRVFSIGGAMPPGGPLRRATVRGTDLPPATAMIIERGGISTDEQFIKLAEPEIYITKHPLHERREDIGIILFRPIGNMDAERGFRRDLEGWNEMNRDGGMRTAELPDREALDQAITMLTTETGTPRIASEVDHFRPLTRVELYTLDGSDLGSLQVGYTDGVVSVRRGTVLWLYPETIAPSMFMLPAPDQIEPEPERVPSGAGGANPQGNK
ncbi:MAG: DUF4340 domain-containing protein [Phycisphaerales bacterium JB050]